jgi:hypothetical protein
MRPAAPKCSSSAIFPGLVLLAVLSRVLARAAVCIKISDGMKGGVQWDVEVACIENMMHVPAVHTHASSLAAAAAHIPTS